MTPSLSLRMRRSCWQQRQQNIKANLQPKHRSIPRNSSETSQHNPNVQISHKTFFRPIRIIGIHVKHPTKSEITFLTCLNSNPTLLTQNVDFGQTFKTKSSLKLIGCLGNRVTTSASNKRHVKIVKTS